MNNRRVRMVDLKRIDFTKAGELVRIPLDKQKTQDVEDITLTAAIGDPISHPRSADNNRCASTVDSEGRFTACQATPYMKIRWMPDRKKLDKLA